MRLDVMGALRAEGQEFPFDVAVLLPDAPLLGETVTFADPARLTGTLSAVGEVIRVRGTLTFTGMSRCMRCLVETSKSMETPVEAVFALAPDPENPDLYLYEGDAIDPLDMAADAATLALPLSWRCGEDCQGLCPVCGVNRNLQPCTCRMEDMPKHPFSALHQLLTEEDGIS